MFDKHTSYINDKYHILHKRQVALYSIYMPHITLNQNKLIIKYKHKHARRKNIESYTLPTFIYDL